MISGFLVTKAINSDGATDWPLGITAIFISLVMSRICLLEDDVDVVAIAELANPLCGAFDGRHAGSLPCASSLPWQKSSDGHGGNSAAGCLSQPLRKL